MGIIIVLIMVIVLGMDDIICDKVRIIKPGISFHFLRKELAKKNKYQWQETQKRKERM